MALDKLKNLFGGEEDAGEDIGTDEEFYSTSREEYHEENGVGV